MGKHRATQNAEAGGLCPCVTCRQGVGEKRAAGGTPQRKARTGQTVRTVMTGYELLAKVYPQRACVTGKKRK